MKNPGNPVFLSHQKFFYKPDSTFFPGRFTRFPYVFKPFFINWSGKTAIKNCMTFRASPLSIPDKKKGLRFRVTP